MYPAIYPENLVAWKMPFHSDLGFAVSRCFHRSSASLGPLAISRIRSQSAADITPPATASAPPYRKPRRRFWQSMVTRM